MIVFRCLTFCLLLSWTAAGQSSFTVDEAVAYARDRDAQVQNSRLDVRISATEAERLQRRWLPQVSASADLRYNPILQTSLLGMAPSSGGSGELVEVEFGTDFTSTLGLLIEQKVFDPVFRAERDNRELDSRRADLDLRYREQRSAWQVRAAYYEALLRQDLYRNSRSLLGRLDTLRSEVRVLVQNELESPSLLNQLNEQLRQQENKALIDSLNWLGAIAGLKLEMHYPADQPLVLSEQLNLAMATDSLALELSDNYEVQKIDLDLEASQVAIDRLQRSRLPTIHAEGFLGANFFSNDPDLYNFDRWYGQSYIGLSLRWPIYQGNDLRYGEELENLQMEQLHNEADAYRNEQQNKAVRVRLQLQEARARQRLSRQLIDSREETLRLARINYRNELTGFGPVLEALQALVQAREQSLQAQITYVQARLEADLLDL